MISKKVGKSKKPPHGGGPKPKPPSSPGSFGGGPKPKSPTPPAKPGGSSGSFQRRPTTPPPAKPKSPQPAKPAQPVRSVPPPTVRPPAGSVPGGAAMGAAVGGSMDTDLSERVQGLDGQLSALNDRVAMVNPRRAVEELDQGIADLAEKLLSIRERGYRFKNYLERKVEMLRTKWQEAEPAIRRELEMVESQLVPMYSGLSQRLSSLMRTEAGGQADALERDIDDLSARVAVAEESIEAAYGAVRQTFYQTRQQVDQVVWLIDELDRSSFELLANENPIQAVPAKWWRDGNDKGPEGNLYLTDQRLLFEQKEKVATKKVLFITTESELIQQLVLATSVTSIQTVKPSRRGIGGHQDHLDIDFSSGDYVNAHFHLQGQDCEEWVALIKRVLNGEIQRERYYAEGEDATAAQQVLEETLAAAPTRCQACGAPLDEEIVRGQHQIQCEYCGTVMRW